MATADETRQGERPGAEPAGAGTPAQLASGAEQPRAPYLEAVVAYASRGSVRFHVPGHKGGAGADPGLCAAIGPSALNADLPQDIEGIDLGAEPTPYQRAELLAAEAHGAARSWFLTNGVTPAALEAALARSREGTPFRAAFIVSPTYYGMSADVETCAAVCHEAGVPVVVDQAWGPHFGFHPGLPSSAL